MIKKVVGYPAGAQETKTVAITKTGTGDLTHVRVQLSGAAASAFEITQPSVTTLNNATASTNFTVKVRDGLGIGNYTATVTVLADNMTNVTFNVEQEIRIAPPSIPNIDFIEAGDKYVTIKWPGVNNASSYKVFSSTIQGSYGPEVAIVTNPISSTVSGSVYEAVYGYTFTNLTNGTPYYFRISSMNAIGESQNSNEVSQTPKAPTPTPPPTPSTDSDSDSSSSSSSSSGSGAAPSNNEIGIIVIVNGKEYTAGKETIKAENGEKQVQLIVNPEVINSKIEEIIKAQINLSQEQKKERNNRVEVPVKADGVTKLTATLTGDMINKMEENEFKLSVKTEDIEYLIPAKEIDIEKAAKALGINGNSLKDISIDVKINKVNTQAVQQITKHAKENNYQIIFPPVDFTVVARAKSITGVESEVTISKFNQYVERIVEIPAGIDPNKITTGVVYNADGTFAHIPTEVFKQGNKYLARLSSFTNSSYLVIWNPITVDSVEHHWSKEYVNDMASRLVIKDPENYKPDAEITRGEFAESITKAIGIYRSKVAKESQFTDVKLTDELADAITIAVEYGIISGYEDHTFKPNEKINREEAMSMYARAMDIVKLSGVDNSRIAKYKDASEVSKWAYDSVSKTISAGVFNGRSEDTIAPKEGFTYAEAATAIRNLLVESKLINK
jgi:hypothetical protein